jgi:hypothetical protein
MNAPNTRVTLISFIKLAHQMGLNIEDIIAKAVEKDLEIFSEIPNGYTPYLIFYDQRLKSEERKEQEYKMLCDHQLDYISYKASKIFYVFGEMRRNLAFVKLANNSFSLTTKTFKEQLTYQGGLKKISALHFQLDDKEFHEFEDNRPLSQQESSNLFKLLKFSSRADIFHYYVLKKNETDKQMEKSVHEKGYKPSAQENLVSVFGNGYKFSNEELYIRAQQASLICDAFIGTSYLERLDSYFKAPQIFRTILQGFEEIWKDVKPDTPSPRPKRSLREFIVQSEYLEFIRYSDYRVLESIGRPIYARDKNFKKKYSTFRTTHHSPELVFAIEVYNETWGKAERRDRTTWPTDETVLSRLKAEMPQKKAEVLMRYMSHHDQSQRRRI